ncbi:hypothetical protein HHI36_018942 [Cryptolaemus montrouzieri]|uniref:Uncharacterized protein n=1 Tax=Cryptolaemus montrouzieri TaxID=559131 RepID=A0ABD2P299_9CUCU
MFLLIIPENGAGCKTYGRESVNFSNMIYPFWSFVILLICSNGASADMSLYPGPKYYLSNGPESVSDDMPLTNENWKYHRVSPIEEYEDGIKKSADPEYDFTGPDNEVTNSRSSLDDILKFLYGKKTRDLDNVNKNYGSSTRLLQDSKPFVDPSDYIDEETDRVEPKWLREEVERNTQRILKKLQENSRKKIADHLQNSYNEESVESGESQSRKPDSQNGASNFAFVPPDPRYYESQSNPITVSETKPVSEPLPAKLVTSITAGGTNTQKTIGIPLRRDHMSFDSPTFTRKYFRHDPTSGRLGEVLVQPKTSNNDATGVYIIAIVAGISAAATVGLIAVGIGWYK